MQLVQRIPQYRNSRLKLQKYRKKNCPIPQYHKPQCPPQDDVPEEETKFKKTVKRSNGQKKTVIQDTDLKCISLTYRIMTINMKGKNDGKGTEERRRDLIKSIIESSSARVIFCQEVPRKFETEVVKKCGYGHYEYGFTGKESAVMWRLKDFDGDPVERTDSLFTKIVEGLQWKKSNKDVSEARRTAMVKLTSVVTGASFLAVSWHGKWKVSEEAKLEAFNRLICFLRQVCEKEKLSSFIIGGDFNFNTRTIDQTKYGVTISRYELSARDQKSGQQKRGRRFTPYRDTFIVSVTVPSDKCPMTGDITVSLVKALELKNESNENVQLDHMPVVGDLKLVCAYPSIKQGRGKPQQYFQPCTFRESYFRISLYNKVGTMLKLFEKIDVRLSQSPLSDSILFSRFFSLRSRVRKHKHLRQGHSRSREMTE